MNHKTALRKDSKQRGEGNTDADYQELSYDEVVEIAREEYADPSDDDLEIDDNPNTSRGDVGCWVQSWVWVRYPAKEDEEE